MKRKYEITLGMMDPNRNMVIDFTSANLTKDIYDARDEFNIYHKVNQVLDVISITPSIIKVELEIDVQPGQEVELYRKVSLFSRRLYNQYNWVAYSSTPNRLLTIVSSNEITVSPTTVATINTNLSLPNESVGVKKEKLRFLYAQKRYTEIQIHELEDQGITIE